MRVIGITGGVGAGKSEILRYLAEKHCVKVIEADKVGHLLMEPGGACYCGIVERFGNGILNEDRTINREKLGKIVFSDDSRLMELNGIVHPRVKQFIVSEIERARSESNISLFIIEAALLLEDRYDMICDEIWYIHVDADVRAARLRKSRGYSDEKIAGIMANQKSPEEFRKACQAVIDNSGSLQSTYEQIDRRLEK